METKNVIYLYTNKINNHKYIGQTVDFKSRHSEHRVGKGIVDNMAIDSAFLKYGEDSFDVKILVSAPNMSQEEASDFLNEMEKYYIWKYDTFNNPNHYNLTEGGESRGSGVNNPQWKEEARIIKGGMFRGKQAYGLRFNGKTLRRSTNKEELLRICDEINLKNIDVHSKDERAYVIKCGFTSNGKQNYAIKQFGKIVKISIFKDKLQNYCDKINLENNYDIAKNIPKNQLSIIQEAHVVKKGIATGKQRYGLVYMEKNIKN